MIKNIIGVYFDFFGTLIDSDYAITNMWSRIAKRLGVEIEYDDPRITAGLLKQYEEANKLGKNYMNFSREDWEKLNAVLIESMGVKNEDSSDIISEEFSENFFKFFRLYPGCRETLNEIKAKNIKIGLHTHASREKAQLRMKELKIFEFFDIFIHTQDYGYNKTHIESYQIALDAMETKNADKIIHVGDNLELDVEMAQKIGMIPILFDPYNKYSKKDIIVISALPEILKFI
ncbi:MAG: HAD family hydrolase [Promethearchaeota archaeon]